MREDVRGQFRGGWGKLVRISAFTWGKLVRNSPDQVGQARENAWGILVRNDSIPRESSASATPRRTIRQISIRRAVSISAGVMIF